MDDAAPVTPPAVDEGKFATTVGEEEDVVESSSDEEGDEEDMKIQTMFRPLSASRRQFLISSKSYDKFAQKQHGDQPKTPRRLYMQTCREVQVNPEPLITRATKGFSLDGGVSLKNYGMGDDQVEALSAGLGVMFMKHLDLSNNRIFREKTASAILSKLDPHVLQKLDMSKNRLGPKSFQILIELVRESTALLSLGLEETSISTACIAKLCEALCRRELCPMTDVVIFECPLKILNLAGNDIDDKATRCIANAIRKSKNLISLDLSWNNIRRQGAIDLFNSIDGKTCIESLDIGYNAIGTSTDEGRSAVHALAKMLSESDEGCSLTHLNLSHNQLGLEDCEILSKALQSNHTLMGVHVEGNQGFIDSRGFLIPDAKDATLQQHATVYSRILPALVNPKLGNRKEEWKAGCNCWVCERWQEYTFVWDPTKSQEGDGENSCVPTSSYKVDLITSYEKWVKQKMNYDEETRTYRLMAMVPPGNQQYAFVVNGGDATVAMDQAIRKRDDMWGNFVEESVKKLPYKVNNVVIKRPSIFDAEKALEPRRKEMKKRKVIAWSFPRSLFAKYRQDTASFLDDCFEFDYSNTGIQKRIAKKGIDPDLVFDEERTKSMLRSYYEDIKHVFKSYSAAIGSGNEVFTMGKNAYYEFVGTCDIMDEDKVKKGLGRAEVALVFVGCQTIGPRSSFNKKNALCRFQFLDALSQFAYIKFVQTKVCSSNAEAVEKLLTEHVLPASDMKTQKVFRDGHIYTEAVDVVLRRNLGSLESLFSQYSGRFNVPGEKGSVSYAEWNDMCVDGRLLDEGFIDRHIRVIYVKSIATCIDELHDKSFRSMDFCQFLHGLCWLSSFMDNTNTSLPAVLQRVITRLASFCGRSNNKKKRPEKG